MAEYELPPLRIKIVGDGKSFQKTVDASVKAAKDGAEEIAKVQKDSAKSGKSVQKDVERETKRHWNRLVRNAEDSYRNMGKLTGFGKSVAASGKTKRQGANSPFANLVKDAEKGAKAARQAADREQSAWRQRFNEKVARRKKEDEMYRKRTKIDDANVAKRQKQAKKESERLQKYLESGKKKLAALESAIHQGAFQANQKIEASQKRQIAAARKAVRIPPKLPVARMISPRGGSSVSRGPVRPGRSGSSGREGGMSFLGDRADIYMHINAVRTLADAWRSPLNALTEYQQRVATLTPVVGSKTAAKSFLEEMSNETVGLIYGMDQIALATTRLTSSNLSLDQTKQLLQSIGNIAAGDSDRFEGLARGLSQISTTGYLQAEEGEQLNERLFPVMALLEKHTGVKQPKLKEMRAGGRISAAAVLAVVNKEAQAGGKYAGTMDSLSQTLGIATKRVENFYKKLNVRVMETVESELVKFVNKLASGIVYLTNWVDSNRDLVKTYVVLAFRVSAAILAFHVLGFTIALVRWQMHALYTITRTLGIALQVLRGIMMVTWAVAHAPIVLVVAGIYAIIVAVQYLYDAINSNEGGLMGAVNRTWENLKKFASATIGFFYNIGHNSKIVAKYIYDNFWVMVSDLGKLIGRFAVNLAIDFAEAMKLYHDVFYVMMGWMVQNAPGWGFSIAEGLWKGFAWLFKKVKGGMDRVILYIATGQLPKDFMFYMSGISENIVKGATNMPEAHKALIDEYLSNRTNAMGKNWDNLGLQSPAMEGLKLEWENPLPALQKTVMEKLGLDNIPDMDFSGGGIPAQDGTDINKLFTPGKGGKVADTPAAVRMGTGEHLDRLFEFRMGMQDKDPVTKATEKVAQNTGKANDILKRIEQALTAPNMKVEPAL